MKIRPIIFLAGTIISVATIVLISHFHNSSLAGPIVEAVTSTSPKPSATTPIRLRIEKIGLDAEIISVGLTSTGAMDTPRSPNSVAWFQLGPPPGEIGSAVIAGHVDWKRGAPAVFSNLSKLKAGDLVSVKDSLGKTSSFAVKSFHTYKSTDIVPEVFSSNQGAHLNLITCAGTWDAPTKSFTERLVIFTDLIE